MGIIIPWCSSRLFPLDRKYAKEILYSIGQKQAVTDKERAQIAIAYHCISQQDAAVNAVKRVGLNQTREIDENWFQGTEYLEMFRRRLAKRGPNEIPELIKYGETLVFIQELS